MLCDGAQQHNATIDTTSENHNQTNNIGKQQQVLFVTDDGSTILIDER